MSKIVLDTLQIHSDDLGEVVGDFHGTPIIGWNPQTTAEREDRDMRDRLRIAKQLQGDPQ